MSRRKLGIVPKKSDGAEKEEDSQNTVTRNGDHSEEARAAGFKRIAECLRSAEGIEIKHDQDKLKQMKDQRRRQRVDRGPQGDHRDWSLHRKSRGGSGVLKCARDSSTGRGREERETR